MSQPTNIPANHDKRIADKLIDLCFAQTSLAPIPALIGSSMPVVFLWGNYDKTHLFLWLTIIWIVYLIAFPGISQAYKVMDKEKNRQLVMAFTIILPLLAGGSWGLTSLLLFVNSSFFLQNLLLAYIMGIAGVTAIIYTAYHPYFLVSSTSMLGPFIIKHWSMDGFSHQVIAAYLLFYLLVIQFLNKKNNTKLKEMLLLQFTYEEQKNVVEKAKKAQTNFFAAASHDLRQPLHVQGLLVSSLRKKIQQPEQLRILDILEQSMDSMRTLLNSLLDFSKLDAGALKPEIRKFNIGPLLDKIFIDFEPQANEKNLKLSMRTVAVTVYSDKLLLERIIRNLINNAIGYTDEGAVLITARRRGENLLVEVRDSGPGIAEQEQTAIFQEFVQSSSVRMRNSPGLGLGLAIVKRLSVLLGIDVGLRSAPGKGSTFWLSIPLAEQDPEVQAPAPRVAGLQIGRDIDGFRVLVVDDNPMILESMREILIDWGCVVETASCGDELIQLHDRSGYIPDLAIVDYRLKGETGVEIYNRFKQRCAADVPVIFITGDTATDKLLELQNNRFPVMHKPVHPDRLYEVILGMKIRPRLRN